MRWNQMVVHASQRDLPLELAVDVRANDDKWVESAGYQPVTGGAPDWDGRPKLA